ncbi:hypothetical protein [Rhodococcus sp. MEB064]|uniref:hypothetical protein n=1 Tax=Rhodococcus sp. MEB064 TaxID=1587522 RepID=UPI0005ACD37F|nr:hypothetical protein [Rhodococcus sp. MEB064]KIQ11766.1 hypothetical protein RU01_18340 [Rhodococcus sp. MEB064]
MPSIAHDLHGDRECNDPDGLIRSFYTYEITPYEKIASPVTQNAAQELFRTVCRNHTSDRAGSRGATYLNGARAGE